MVGVAVWGNFVGRTGDVVYVMQFVRVMSVLCVRYVRYMCTCGCV